MDDQNVEVHRKEVIELLRSLSFIESVQTAETEKPLNMWCKLHRLFSDENRVNKRIVNVQRKETASF